MFVVSICVRRIDAGNKLIRPGQSQFRQLHLATASKIICVTWRGGGGGEGGGSSLAEFAKLLSNYKLAINKPLNRQQGKCNVYSYLAF